MQHASDEPGKGQVQCSVEWSVANHPLQDYFSTEVYDSKSDFSPIKSHRVTVPKSSSDSGNSDVFLLHIN